MIKVVTHYNKIKSHINYVVNQSDSAQEIYCKKLHKLTVPQETDCSNCPYFDGFMGGYGHACTWEDVVPSDVDESVVEWADRGKELMRVSYFIDQGLIKKG